jgi:hypothetical protein
MLQKGRLVRNQHTVRMSLIIPTFYDSREYNAEYCLTTNEAVHLSASYTVQGSSTQIRSISFHNTDKIFTYVQLPRSLAEVQTWTVHHSIPNHIPLPFHDIIWIWKAVKLCTSIQTPNHLVQTIFWIYILPPSSESLLKTQAVCSSETVLPRPRYFNLDHITFLHCENLK